MKKNYLNLYKNIIWQYGLQLLRYFFPFILIPYLTRALETEGYAVYAYVLSFMGIMQTLADFGFTLSGTRSAAKNRDSAPALSLLLSSVTIARLIVATVLCCGLVLISQFIPIMRGNMPYVMLAYCATVLRALLPDFIFQGFEEMGPLTTRYFISKIVTVVTTILLVHSSDDLLFVAMADAAGGVVAIVWSYGVVKNRYGVHLLMPPARSVIKELKTSAIYCVSNIGSTLVSGFTTFMVGIMLTDSADIAYWSLALTTVSAVQALYAPISNSLYPHIVAHNDLKPAKVLSALAAPALLIGTGAYCVLSPTIFQILGGGGYEQGSWVMIALSPMLPISFYAMLFGWPILGALGRVRELTASTVLSGLVNVGMLVLLNAFNRSSLLAICIVRCLAELTLLVTRVLVLMRVKKAALEDSRG